MAVSAPKVVLVTGSSEGGIGYALCVEFARRGCIVYASARRLASLSSLLDNVRKVELDVSRPESCRAVVERIIHEQGRIDILVNNAGAGYTSAILDADVDSDEGVKAVFDTNVFAPLRLAKLVAPHMAERRSGLIVNIGSIVGNIPTPWAGIYAASKAALHSATETLRMEVKGLHIDVMLVAPGAITSNFGKKQADSFKLPEDSLYRDVADKIAARAQMSQDSGYSIPASLLAQGVVSRALRSRPGTYFSAGGKAFSFWLLERLPRPLVWFLLSRRLGCDVVGQSKRGEAKKTA
ncbi:hypothetical protein JCM8547_008955 [Rhodosporidiobolus lusitaniae]